MVNLEMSAWSSEETMESDNGVMEDPNEKPDRMGEVSGAEEESEVTGNEWGGTRDEEAVVRVPLWLCASLRCVSSAIARLVAGAWHEWS